MHGSHDIHVAIIGGGLAGATLMNALLSLQHVQVDIFESAPAFSERGAAVGIATNAQAALEEIGGEMSSALERAGAVDMHSSRLPIAHGPDAGTAVMEIAPEHMGKVVHRAALLKELLKSIPAERMHTSKKLVRIEESTDQPRNLKLHFDDQTVFDTDAVIGADGIHSSVRTFVLGSEHDALKPVLAGFWDCRSLVPMARAREVLGDEYVSSTEPRQYGWLGDGGFLMHDILDGGDTVQVVASCITDDTWDPETWKKVLSREDLERAFGKWENSPIKDKAIELLLDNENLTAFAQCHHAKALTTPCSRSNLCLIGDAAHAMTPWQGSGAGQAIEDAMVLSALLAEVRESSQLQKAFEAYDGVRRPRAGRIVESSAEAGKVMCGRDEGVGLDVERMRAKLGGMWGFIYAVDQKKQVQEALTKFRGLL